jgi:ubiquinone/menaquinone biosynthesis C-methylase UbiE
VGGSFYIDGKTEELTIRDYLKAHLHSEKKVFAQQNFSAPSFELAYVRVREIEGRICPDEMVAQLPEVPKSHALSGEWHARRQSMKALISYLQKSNRFMRILDVGCGNGWFSNRIAMATSSEVCGIDVNLMELHQAARVFESSRVSFMYGNIMENIFPEESFDAVLLSSAIQYFPDLALLIHRLLKLITASGEIHIIDSPFYSPDELPSARERTRQYYERVGSPEMSKYYFHHSWDVIHTFDVRITEYTSRMKLFRKLRGSSPFPWIRVLKSA